MTDGELRLRLAAYLAGHSVLGLATGGPAGPWCSPVFFVHDEALRLYFLSSPDTRHGQNLAASPRAAGAITADYRDWREIQGIQLEGSAAKLSGAEREEALALYLAKFPSAAPFLDPAHPAYARAGGKVALYRLTPVRLGLTDNQRGFGSKEWLELQG